ncbi:nucleotidyltransferase substrate binding protein [Clostridium cylindrosporum]|uniref:Nucleotidyltransferase substrate binding protein n=1 Tax=Clostridium cylindrosporum DSM 605 TaxID=1121307 RepID=A0A0J8G5J1_CLOCY|nr:nucleotidyltransferase substrate binding protein [Clostridium cylindrosporum]KMT22921.1 nucleotidyltransferase substrate binding protein [Clostridium cylindrosporum DSM 605]
MSKRWEERIDDFSRAVLRLKEAIEESSNNVESTVLKDGVIQRFEFTYELCWKSMKVFLENEGIEEAKSPRSTFREGFKYGLISDGELWIDMLKDRNLTSHVYDEELVEIIYKKIIDKYFCELENMKNILSMKVVDDDVWS